jgi:ADP-ribosylglycohydrolase
MPFPLRQRLLGNKGTVSDDTVQSALVLSALMRCDGSSEAFTKILGKDLKKWFLAVPPGIGLATIKACLRLLVGVPPTKSGVNSAGNGAAMRAAVIGAALAKDDGARTKFVEASCLITHSHSDAIFGAQLVALAASLHAKAMLNEFDVQARNLVPNWKWDMKWEESGPTGYVVQSVNAAIKVTMQPGITLEQGIEEAISLGGDTDTVAAIVGGILGSKPVMSQPTEALLQYVGWPQPKDIMSITGSSRF